VAGSRFVSAPVTPGDAETSFQRVESPQKKGRTALKTTAGPSQLRVCDKTENGPS